MALNKGIWDPKLRGAIIKGTNLKSLSAEINITQSIMLKNSGAGNACGVEGGAGPGLGDGGPWRRQLLFKGAGLYS